MIRREDVEYAIRRLRPRVESYRPSYGVGGFRGRRARGGQGGGGGVARRRRD